METKWSSKQEGGPEQDGTLASGRLPSMSHSKSKLLPIVYSNFESFNELSHLDLISNRPGNVLADTLRTALD